MKKLFGLFAILVAILATTPAQAVTVQYQPTPYPLKRCASGPGCPGGAMPQDINIVHTWDGWLNNSFNTTFVRDDKLQIGGYGDQYRLYAKHDLIGLPANVSSAVFWMRSYSRGDNSTTTPFAVCKVLGT